MRLAYKFNDRNKLSLFYNRRVDRPNEVDIRIFPKYDDAEIIKVGNPALRPQFTNTVELGYKNSLKGVFLFGALPPLCRRYHYPYCQYSPGSTLIYAIFQNAGRSYNTGVEMVLTQDLQRLSLNLNLNGYHNQIDAFRCRKQVSGTQHLFRGKQEIFSGNVKLNTTLRFPENLDAQFTAIYLAPELIPQGKVGSRFSLDAGIKKTSGKGTERAFFERHRFAEYHGNP